MKHTITWFGVAACLPDPEADVLIALSDGTIHTGWHEEDTWRFIDATPVCHARGNPTVTHWAGMPPHPAPDEVAIPFRVVPPPAKCPACNGKGVVQSRLRRILTTTVCPECNGR